MNCPECEQPENLVEERFPQHTIKGISCRMSRRLPDEWPLPASTAISGHALELLRQGNDAAIQPAAGTPQDVAPTPVPQGGTPAEPAPAGRKVRSDKGSKRGQRTKGPAEPVPTRRDAQDTPPGGYLVLDRSGPAGLIATFEAALREGCEWLKDPEKAKGGVVVYEVRPVVYEVRPRYILEQSIGETRIGRVRKIKAAL